MNEFHLRTSPILIYDIEPELDAFLKENRNISIDDYIEDIKISSKSKFRVARLKKFVEPSLDNFERCVVDSFSKFGSAFLNPDFIKTFAVTYPPGFSKEFPNYPIKNEYQPEGIQLNFNPWFLWLKDYVLKSLTFSKGMLTDLPFCFLLFYPYSKINNVNTIIQEILQRDLPNIFNSSDSSDMKKMLGNSKFVFAFFKSKFDPELKEEVDKSITYKIFQIDNFKDELSTFTKNLYNTKFLKPHEELKRKIENPKKKIFGSKTPQPMDKLIYSVQLFSSGNFEAAYEPIQSLDEKQSPFKKYAHFINLMKTVVKIFRSGDEKDKLVSFRNSFNEDNNSPLPFNFLLLIGVIFINFIGDKNNSPNGANEIIKSNFTKLVKLTEKVLADHPRLMNILCGVWYDEIYSLNFRSEQKRRVPLNLLMAAKHYHKAGMDGHTLRCYAFLQSVLSRSSDDNKNSTFICGRIKDNVFLPLQRKWQSLGCFALWKLSKTLALTKQYQSALQLNIILLAAPKCELVPDQKIFSVLHAYFNFLNIDQLILESLPLVGIDQERVKFAVYGGFEYKKYDQRKFEHLLQHHRKKFKDVRDNLQMWRKSKFQCDEVSVPIVCGEKNEIIIPLSNRRSTEINLSNLSLIDSNNMIESKCKVHDPSLSSNQIMTIPISFVTHKTGPFSITGISFIYWAILKDTLQLNPFKFIALDNQPSLEAQLINFPTKMNVGECCSFTCRLRNFGSADMSNVIFVHDAPFSISFENVRDWRMMCNSVSVSLLNQKLKPNESVDVPCYIRAREPGLFKIRMIFSFLANLPLRWRFFPDEHTIEISKRDSFECKILDHPLSNSKKLVYINGTTAEKEATIKSVSILGCKIVTNKEEVIPPNSSLSCVREVETIPQAISVSAISSAALRLIAPTPPPSALVQGSVKSPMQAIKASSTSLNNLLGDKSFPKKSTEEEEEETAGFKFGTNKNGANAEINNNDSHRGNFGENFGVADEKIVSNSDSESSFENGQSEDSSKEKSDLVIEPRMKHFKGVFKNGSNMPISFSTSSLKSRNFVDGSGNSPHKSPSLSQLNSSSSPTSPKVIHLKGIQKQSIAFQKQAHLSFDPTAALNSPQNGAKLDWREQFLAVDESGFIVVDTQNSLLSQFNIGNTSTVPNNICNYTYEGCSKNSVINNVFSLRGNLSAPSIIKFNENQTIEVVLKLKNVGSCDSPPLTIYPKEQDSNQLFWVSKVSHKIKVLKPGQETALSFNLLVCNTGVFDIGFFVFKSKIEKQVHFTHILSVY